ncbi:MAG TPA: 4Fe-4S dicluster domain-containing protein [Desulfosarcina sp.]|nr:4Fe-4S dicluster domain-containing protein [Desulfosarcina sp.]
MKQVVVHPERCVGCMQCMLACATAHSRSLTLFGAVQEIPRPRARIHVGAGRFNEGFPNRCRHCDPAPCQAACLAGAIYRRENAGTVMINPDRCINCASCAMACPYGVIRFHEDPLGPPGQATAVKCDNCSARVSQGRIPACVEICKAGALTWEAMDEAMRRKTRDVARSVSPDAHAAAMPAGVALMKSIRQSELRLSRS